MQLTYKRKHWIDFSVQLKKAKLIANFAIANRDKLSSKFVKEIGLPSAISNQILRKYGKNYKAKKCNKVNLIVPGQSLKIKDWNLRIVPLKLEVSLDYFPSFTKVNQIEIDSKYFYITVSVVEPDPFDAQTVIGIDRNTKWHIAVCADLSSWKVVKLWKSAQHIANKYKNIRKHPQTKWKFKALKRIKNKQSRIQKDLNHKASRSIVNLAIKTKWILVLEELKWIRKVKSKRSFRYELNNWWFYQLQLFIEYKAKLAGVKVVYVDPAYTSKTCFRCWSIENPQWKRFHCTKCWFVEHRDVNASFNIANRYVQSCKEWVLQESYTGVAQEN